MQMYLYLIHFIFLFSGLANIVDVVSVVSTATSASITNINKKLKAVGKIDTVKNCEKLGMCSICEMITILLYYYCVDNIYNENENNNILENNDDNNGDKYYLLSSQIALWGCRAINNLAKSYTMKIRFIEIGGKELINSLAQKYGNSKMTLEWISMAKDTLNQ